MHEYMIKNTQLKVFT